jgi:inositol-pentakisphosphate 2-kinase
MSFEFWPSGMPTMSDWADFLDTYLSPISSKFDHSQPTPGNFRYYLQAYLLSATFKDCSIIIRLDISSLKGRPTEAVKADRVTVIDLDPKSVHRLQNWEKLDEEITQAYLDVDKPKRCIDGWMDHVASGVSVERRLSNSSPPRSQTISGREDLSNSPSLGKSAHCS